MNYPNQEELIKNRLLKLQETRGVCQVCGGDATMVHHIDGSTDNHIVDNLMAICGRCHHAVHYIEKKKGHNRRRLNPNKPYASKYRRAYGLTQRQICALLKCSPSGVVRLHHADTLAAILDGRADVPRKHIIPLAEQRRIMTGKTT